MVDIVRNKRMILKLAKNDFKSRYAGSFLGIVWAFVQPCVTVAIYAFVFGTGLKVTPVDSNFPFLLYLIAGIIPYFFLNDAVNNVTNCIVEYSYILKKMKFNANILPLVKIVSSLFVHFFFILLAMLIFILHHRFFTIHFIQIAYYLVCTIVLSIALGYFTSAVTVFFRDLSHIVNIILQFCLWLTPIMYDLDYFPEWIGNILKFNPLYYIVTGYRDSFYGQVWFFEHASMTVYFWVVTIVLFVIGYKVFKKLRPSFADVL